MKSMLVKLSLVSAAAALTACGGGGGSDNGSAQPGGSTGSTGGTGGTPAVENIGGVFTGSGMAFGRNQEVTAAYGNGVVYYFTGDTGANVMTARVYGKGTIANQGGRTTTSEPANQFNASFLENGRSGFSRFTGTYSPNAANAASVSVNVEATGGTAFASMNRDAKFKQTPSTQLPAGTYRARVSTTGEIATMVVSGTGGFSLTTANNCRITGSSNAAPIAGTAAAGVRLEASPACIPGSSAPFSMDGVGLVGANNARLLIGANQGNAAGLSISAELTSTTPAPTNTFPNKANGVFTNDNGRVVFIIDDNDQITAIGAPSNNPSLYTFVVTGRANFNGVPTDGTSSFLSTFSGNATAYSLDSTFSATIDGRLSAPKSAPTVVGGIRMTMLRPGGQVGFVLGDGDLPSVFGHVYNYNQPASLAAAAGRYGTREFLGGPLHEFNISQSGVLTGTLGSCRLSGQLTPRNKNLFDVVVNFGGATDGCANTMVAGQSVVGQTYRGVSYLSNIGEISHVFAWSNTVTGKAYGVRMGKCGTGTVC